MDHHLARRLIVTVSAAICAVGTLFGLGVIGSRVAESSGGRLSADATLIAPHTTAFSIWSVIYLGLAAYVIWQWLPSQRTSPRLRSTGMLAAASMVLNAAWLLVTQADWLVVSVGVMVALVVALGVLVRRLYDQPATSWGERIVVDGTFGLYLGWVCVALCANIAATLVDAGVPAIGTGSEIATVIVIAAVVAIAWVLSHRLPGQLAVAAGIVWGLAWVAVGRFTDEPRSTVVGSAAVVASVLIGAAFAMNTSRTSSASAPG